MKLSPIPRVVLTTPVTITIGSGQTRYGETASTTTWTGFCRFEEKMERTLDAERRLITLSGHIYTVDDPAPDVDLADGTVTIGTRSWTIYKGIRYRNPDNTIHHVKIMLR